MTTLNQYQEEASTTAAFPRFYTEAQVAEMLYESNVDHADIPELLDRFETPLSRLVYPILGLVGEAGELANKVKKWGRDSGGEVTDDQQDALADELGDTLWYVAATSTGLRMDLGGIAEANLSKLFSRQQRGVIQGNGDNR